MPACNLWFPCHPIFLLVLVISGRRRLEHLFHLLGKYSSMLFGSSGIRRRYGPDLVGIACKAGAAIGAQSRRVVIGRDTRTTGPVIAAGFTAGALSSGADLIDGGIAPTPTIAYATRHADTGCAVTASHNPELYNGLKLLNPDGSSFTLKQQAILEAAIDGFFCQDWEHQGMRSSADITTPHIEAVLTGTEPGDCGGVVLDCGNGAGSMITPQLLSMAGIRTWCVNCNPHGRFGRPSEPLPEHLGYIPPLIRKTGAGGALIHDGDADRFMAFDNKGRFIPGDCLMVLFARYLGAKRVVTTVDASMVVEEFAQVRRTRVGDSFVSEALLDWGDFGGEPSGAWIFPRHSLCPDGVYAAALFCRIASETEIAAAVDAIPRYPVIRRSIACNDSVSAMQSLGAASPTDGIRIAEEDGWYLIRASGTEPKVRVTAEGRDEETAERLAAKAMDLLKGANR